MDYSAGQKIRRFLEWIIFISYFAQGNDFDTILMIFFYRFKDSLSSQRQKRAIIFVHFVSYTNKRTLVKESHYLCTFCILCKQKNIGKREPLFVYILYLIQTKEHWEKRAIICVHFLIYQVKLFTLFEPYMREPLFV